MHAARRRWPETPETGARRGVRRKPERQAERCAGAVAQRRWGGGSPALRDICTGGLVVLSAPSPLAVHAATRNSYLSELRNAAVP